METIKRIKLNNIVTYENLNLKINEGLSVFRGKNRSGKSLIFSSIANVLYNAPPLETKKKSAKTLLTNKNSSINLKFSNFSALQEYNSKSIKLSLFDKNNNLINVKDPRNVLVKDYWCLTENHFYSQVYLSSFRFHPLLNGSGPLRHQFFNNIFDLDIYDKIKEKLSDKINSLKEDEVYLKILKPEVKTLEEELLKIEKLIQSYSFDGTLLKEFPKIHENYLLYKQQKEIKKNIVNDIPKEEILIKIKNIKTEIDELNLNKDKITIKIDKSEENNNKFNIKLKLKKKLKEKVSKPKDIDKLIKNLNCFEKKYSKKVVQKEVYNKYNIIKTKLDGFNCKLSAEETKLKIEDLNYNYKQSLKILKLNNKCPTCNHKITKALKKKAKKLIKEYKKDYNNYILYKELLGFNKKDTLKNPNLTKIETKIKNLKHDIKENKEKTSKYNKYKLYKNKYKDLESIEYVDVELLVKKRKLIISKIKKLESELTTLNKDLGLKASIKTIKKPNIKKYKKQKKLYVIHNNNKHQYDIIIDRKRNINSELEAKKEKLNKLNKKVSNLEIYKILLDAYGARGIKTSQVERVAYLFEENLNHYASIIFGEPFSFRIEVNKNNMSIIAVRNNLSSDVYMLSGSESRAFSLLCLISLIPLIPSNMRSNFVILDEMDHGFDTYSRQLYTQEYIPYLNNLVKQVIMITPLGRQELYVEDAYDYKIVKKDNKSKVILL